ncbi:MAG: hypothetical protein EOO20_11450 [Chryseobacterium sp.]|nr:MAG: hypothetical protein EOO20_11450 [Chryseobacterium sp.]
MSFSIDQFLQVVNATFEPSTVSYQELNYNGKIPVFFVKCCSIEELEKHWTGLVDSVAFDFQSQLTDEFQVWNIYMFFIKPLEIKDSVRFNSLKLKIENDTFSSRKIVVEDQAVGDIINEHIVNKNVNFSVEKDGSSKLAFTANPLLWSLLEDKTLKRQKLTAEATSTFDDLVQRLKNKTHEI